MVFLDEKNNENKFNFLSGLSYTRSYLFNLSFYIESFSIPFYLAKNHVLCFSCFGLGILEKVLVVKKKGLIFRTPRCILWETIWSFYL